MLPLNNLHSK